MNATEVLHELESLGSEQTRKTYGRHGVAGPMFGVSYANLEKLRKRIKVDHDLATSLWASGNHDARVLATKIADPSAAKANQLNLWVKDCGDHVIAGAVAAFAATTPLAEALARKWTPSRNEWVSAAGWSVVACLASGYAPVDEPWLEECLKTIETTIHSGKNRARYAMLNALIAIGGRDPRLAQIATEAAHRIGPVEIDHGDTNCKTPEPVSYIRKTLEHRQKMQAKAVAKNKSAKV